LAFLAIAGSPISDGRLALERQSSKHYIRCQQESELNWGSAGLPSRTECGVNSVMYVRAVNPLQYYSRAKQELPRFLGSLERFAYLIHQSTGLFLFALVLGSAGVDDKDG